MRKMKLSDFMNIRTKGRVVFLKSTDQAMYSDNLSLSNIGTVIGENGITTFNDVAVNQHRDYAISDMRKDQYGIGYDSSLSMMEESIDCSSNYIYRFRYNYDYLKLAAQRNKIGERRVHNDY